jgi:ABC-type multidrug transport system fused ATPase/permease subunit
MAIVQLPHILRTRSSISRILQITERTPLIPSQGGLQLNNVKGDIEFQNVYFSYPTRPDDLILKNLSIQVSRNQKIAIVGETGSGKSTILQLIARFYDPTRGNIYLDGVDIRKLDPEWYRKNFAVVLQEPALFGTTIYKNITYGISDENDISMEQVIQVAKHANCHDFISRMPLQYDTHIAESGLSLSVSDLYCCT